MKRMLGSLTALILSASFLVLGAGPAHAFCHDVAFEHPSYSFPESVGTASIKVHLVGPGTTCSGTVDYATEAVSAEAGEDKDYVHQQGTLTLNAATDREKTIMIRINNDSKDELNETFRVQLSNATNGLRAGGPTTVTINDDDDPAPPPSPAAKKSPSPSPPPSPSPEASPSPETSPSPSPSPTVSPSPAQAVAGEEGGFPGWLIPLIIGLIAIGGGGLWWLRRRPTT